MAAILQANHKTTRTIWDASFGKKFRCEEGDRREQDRYDVSMPRIWPFVRIFTAVLAGAALCGCAPLPQVRGPQTTLDQYLEALRQDQPERAYTLLDEETRATVSKERFVELWQSNRSELEAQARQLEAPSLQTAEARLALDNGDSVKLLLEDGGWAVDESLVTAPALRTPQDSLLALRSTLYRRDLRGFLRVLARQPRAQFNAEIQQLLEDLEDELDFDTQVEGNHARVETSSGRVFVLVREAGEWHVVSFR